MIMTIRSSLRCVFIIARSTWCNSNRRRRHRTLGGILEHYLNLRIEMIYDSIKA